MVRNTGFILQMNIDGRPNLKLEWLITFLEPGLIKLENENNQMVLERHCPDVDDDLTYIDGLLIQGTWEVALYQDGDVDKTEEFFMYSIDFLENGYIKVTDPNYGIIDGSWLAYRSDGLFLGMHYGIEAPFDELNYRWRIVDVSLNRIELKDLSSTGTVERRLVLERKE